jgi:hypothetical protein
LFDRLELAVIAIAGCDPLTRNMGLKVRVIAWVFGIKPPNALADPRLEALRLLVIALRRRGHHPGVEVTAAQASGFSQEQVDWLLQAGSVDEQLPTPTRTATHGAAALGSGSDAGRIEVIPAAQARASRSVPGKRYQIGD